MTKTLRDVTTIVRNVTGRTDGSVSDNTIFAYITDFYQLIMGQEMRLFEGETYYTLNIDDSADEYPIDASAIGYSILRDPVWIDGFRINFHTDPSIFFAKWPETQDYTKQRPIDVLWYDGMLTFRSPPDAVYEVKMRAYALNEPLTEGDDSINEDYWFRYLAYGASIDLLGDVGEYEKVAQVMPLFERYKSLVNARTYTQLTTNEVIRKF